jgi:hypothetical protein
MPLFSPVPAPAAAAGFNTLTFGPQLIIGGYPGDNGNWQRFNFFSNDWTKTVVTVNDDGSIVMWKNGSNSYAAVLCSASFNQWAKPYMRGVAFGGGGYFETLISFNLDTGTGGATFWAEDVEGMAGGTAGDLSAAQWPGQAPKFIDAMEVDFMEFDPAPDMPSSQTYGSFVHNNWGPSGGSPPVGNGSVFNVGPVDFNEPHRYGSLWVPATKTTQGSLTTYFDRNPVGKVIRWNLYDPTLAPPPVDPGSAYSVLDQRHLALILGNFGSNPVTVHGVSVWQASAANNIVI